MHWLTIVCLLLFNEVQGFIYGESYKNMPAKQSTKDAGLATDCSYRIRTKQSNMYVSDVSYKSATVEIQQWPLLQDENKDSQIWFLFPVGYNHYIIANKRTGMVMIHTGTISQFPLKDIPNAWQSWELLQEDSTYYLMRNESNGAKPVLAVCAGDALPGRCIKLWTFYSVKGGRDTELFAFEVAEKFPEVKKAEESVVHDVTILGAITRISGWHPPKPSKTEGVLLGQMSIPFVLVTDPELTLSQQAMLTPFYVLRRFGYWQVVQFYDHTGSSQTTVSTNLTVGLISGNARQLDTVLGLSVSAEGWLVLRKSRPPLTSWKMGSSLKINVDVGYDDVSSRSVRVERKFVSLSRQLEAIWYRHDRFVLERSDGSPALEWVIRDPVAVVNDGFRGRSHPTPSDTELEP